MIASTASCSATSRSTSGIVSRVSPPAQSIGLLRLQRGGNRSSIGGAQVGGQVDQLEVAIAGDGVGGDDAPATRRRHHDHRGRVARAGWRTSPRPRTPPRRCRAGDPGGAALAVEHLVVGGQRSGVAGRGTRAAGGGATLEEYERLVAAPRRRAGRTARGRRRSLRRRRGRRWSPDRRRRRRDSRRRTRPRRCRPTRRGRCPRRLARARLRKLDTKLPLWLATAMRPGGGYGATIWAHSDTGVLTTPWPFGPASRMPQSSARRRAPVFGTPALRARLAVAGRGDERRLDPLACARLEQFGVGAGGVHTKTRSAAPSGISATSPTVVHAEHLLAVQVGAVDGAAVPGCQQVVQRHETELAGMRRRPGDDDTTRLEQGGELLGVGAAPAGGRCGVGIRLTQFDEGVDGDRRSVGGDDQRVDVDAGHVVALGDHPAEGDERRRQGVPVDSGLAAERSEQRPPCAGRRSSRLPSRRSSGAGRNTTSPTASASTPPTPSITVGPNCGSRNAPAISSRVPATIGATSRSTSPSSGRAAAKQDAGRRADGVGVGEAEANEAALGLVGDALAVELEHDGKAERRRGGDGGVHVAGVASSAQRHAERRRAAPWTPAPTASSSARSDS